ncbi:MAG: hypothetical protein WED07_15465 [Candidatus Freyarchaeum deiterrae]
MTGRKKIAIAVMTVLLLVTLIPLFHNANTLALPVAPTNDSTTSTTLQTALDQPVFGNLVSQQLTVYLSAIDNSADVAAASTFNGSFFGLPDLSSFPGVVYAYAGIQVQVQEEGVNATAPHTSYLFAPMTGSLVSGPFGISVINETVGLVMVEMVGSNITACNQTAQQISQALIEKLASLGLSFRELTAQFTSIPYPAPMGGNITIGYLLMTSLNDSVTTYNYLESLLPEGTLAQSIAQESSNEKYIALFDTMAYNFNVYPPQLTWNALVQVGSVLENQTSVNGNTYSYTLGSLFAPSNETIKSPVTINLYPPVNSNVTSLTGFYPGSIMGGYTQPLFSYNAYSDVNADNFNITYTLETGVPYIVVYYDMSNWNMNPGDNGTLYLTIRNVGTSNAFNISGNVYCYNTNIMYFSSGLPYPSSGVSFYFDEIDVGQNETLAFNVVANSIGTTQFSSVYNWRRASNGLVNFGIISQFSYNVGIPGPNIIVSVDYSKWVLNPNDVFSGIYTIRNVGTQTATNVTASSPPIIPLAGGIIDSNITIPTITTSLSSQFQMFLGDIPAGSSIVGNQTMRYDLPLLGSVHTGLGPESIASSQIFYNNGVASLMPQPSPVLMPGVRPSNAIYIEFEKTPETVNVNPGDEVSVSVKVKNLGLTDQTIYAFDWYPQDAFELVSGSNFMKMDIASGSSVTMTYTLRAITTANLALPPPTLVAYWSPILFGGNLLGTPLNSTTHNTAYVDGNFLVNAVEEAGVEISGTTPVPTTLNTWGNSPPPSATLPKGVIPLNYIRAESNESINATLVFHYTDDEVPAGVSEQNLTVFQWDEQNMKWVELPSVVNTASKTVTVEVSGFSYFMLGAKVPVEEVFTGMGALQISGQLFIGKGDLHLSENTIKIEISGQSASWNIVKHLKTGNLDVYVGEGALGRVTLTIQRGNSSIALAIGKGALFIGSS